jgi:hypothetical protein
MAQLTTTLAEFGVVVSALGPREEIERVKP